MEENQVHIPDGWVEDSLGNILNYEQPYKYTVDSTDYDDKSGIPVLTAGKSFILGYTTEQHNVYKNTPVIIFDDFTTDCKFVDFPFKVKSSAMKFLKPKNPDEFDIKIIFGHLQNLKIRETGGDHKRRWISEFSKLKVFLPPFTEQNTIARILYKVDEALAQTEQLIAKYTRIKIGLMQDLLTNGVDEQGNMRSEATHEFKDSPLGRIPKEWEVVTLSFFIDKLESGVSVNSDDIPIGGNQLGILKTSSLSQCRFNPKQNKTVKSSDIRRLKCPVRKGAILISRMNTPDLVGENALVKDHYENLYLPDRIWQTVYKNGEQLNVDWLASLLASEQYRKTISFLGTGTSNSMKNISKKSFLEILIPKVPVEEQKEISLAISGIESFEASNSNQLSKLKSLKSGLMQDLLRGKVRVNHIIIKENESV